MLLQLNIAIFEIKELLIKQIESPVRWRESVQYMISKGTSIFIEIGPGKVLSGLIKRINKDVKVLDLDKLEDIQDIKNMINLENKNIIITGATGGIGFSLVDTLAF